MVHPSDGERPLEQQEALTSQEELLMQIRVLVNSAEFGAAVLALGTTVDLIMEGAVAGADERPLAEFMFFLTLDSATKAH